MKQTMARRVLVCGGRTFNDRECLYATLDAMHAEHPFALLIQGMGYGADTLAGEWADARDVPQRKFPAWWSTQGSAAGPIRNQRMLRDGKPDLVVAFPGGRGTADMIRRARAAGVEVFEPLTSNHQANHVD